MNEDMFPAVVQAFAGENYIVYAYMLDGTVRKLDMKPFIQSGGIFERLKDQTFFKNALTVMNDTVAWDLSGRFDPSDCIDIDPFTVAECEMVADPLQMAG